MTRRERIARVEAAGSLAGVPGIPLLLLVGLILFLTAIVSSSIGGSLPEYWSQVAIWWLSVFFVFAIIGVLAGYWLPRVGSLVRGRGTWVPGLDSWLLSNVGALPVVGFTVLIVEWDGDPVWAYVLGALSLILGVGAMIDTYLVLRRSASTKQRRRRRG